MKKKINKKHILILGFVLICLFCLYKIFISPLSLNDKEVDVEVQTKYNPESNISHVILGNKKDVIIDKRNLDTNKVGEYEIVYKYKNKEYPVTINVVDTTPPSFDIHSITIENRVKPDPKSLVMNIKDASKTKVSFKEDYNFDDVGDYDVEVVVSDIYDNSTTKSAVVHVIKDDKGPEIKNIEPIDVVIGGDENWENDVIVKDDHDPNPKLIFEKGDFNPNKEGKYYVTYKAVDRAGNVSIVKREVNVVKSIGTTKESEEKIVYLTFDDGPSANTKKILDILDKYDAKATFFVTGNNKQYNSLIKVAHDRGHTIGLHTYTHDYAKVYKSKYSYFDDLNKLEKMIKDIIGYSPRYIRFPGGSSNTVSSAYKKGIMTYLTKEVQNRGYQYYDWNCDSTDASGNNVAVSKLIENATNCSENNINILFHDTDAKDTTVEALPKIIKYYKDRGYVFKAIDDNSFAPHHGVNN